MRVKRESWRTTMALARLVASTRSKVRLVTSARSTREKKWQAERKDEIKKREILSEYMREKGRLINK